MDFEYSFEQGKEMIIKKALPLVIGTIIVALVLKVAITIANSRKGF